MAFSVGTISATVNANDKPFMNSINRVHKKGMKVSQQLGDSFMSVGRKMTMGLTVPIGLAGGAMIKMASDAEETEAKFNTVFRDISKQAQDSAKVLTKSFGLSQKASQELLGDTGDLLTGFGFTQKSALGLSEEVNKLAVDLASFTNFSGGAEGASKALTKALLGERESVKSLGISILEADVNAKILQNTQKGLTFETERQAKAYATLQLAQEQSKNAIGDFARTQDSFANQMRQLRAEVSDLAVEFGKELLPIAKDAAGVARNLIENFSGLSDESKRLGLKIAGIAAIAGPTLLFFGSMFKAVSSLAIVVPKLVVGVKALTAAMMANPYVAVATAITAIGVGAYKTLTELRPLRKEIEEILKTDVRVDQLSEVEEGIKNTKEKLEELRNSGRQGILGDSMLDVQRIDELEQKLGDLEQRRSDIRMEMLRQDIAGVNQEAKFAVDVTKLWNASMGDTVKITDEWADAQRNANEYLKATRDLLPSINVNNVGNISGSIAGMREELIMLQSAQDQVNLSTKAGKAAYSEIGALITELQKKINNLTGNTKDLEETATGGGQALMGLANSIGQVFSQAVLHANNLESVVKNLLKQLASKAFVIGLGSLLTGGASLGGATFLEALFGGARHTGGLVPDGGERQMTLRGGEGVFTKGQMAAMGLMVRSGGGGSMDEGKLSRAFERALDRKLSKLGARDIYALAQQGRFS